VPDDDVRIREDLRLPVAMNRIFTLWWESTGYLATCYAICRSLWNKWHPLHVAQSIKLEHRIEICSGFPHRRTTSTYWVRHSLASDIKSLAY
jgi:hypothetical protein